ncbi:hypothetical protein Dimus_024150 [Dionaea muscipula]
MELAQMLSTWILLWKINPWRMMQAKYMQSELRKLFIGGVSRETNEDRLREYFSTFGDVVEAVIMKDQATGRALVIWICRLSRPIVAERVIKEKHNIDGRMPGAFVGVSLEGNIVVTRMDTNLRFYGDPYLTTSDILLGTVERP